MFQWRILTDDYIGNHGLALAHPLYIAIGKIFLLLPLGQVPAKLNSTSGIGMAIALANLMILATGITGRQWIGFVTAAMVSMMHTVWWLATIAEVYTWHAALFTTELIALVQLIKKPRWETATILFFFNGINLSIHNLALLTLPIHAATVIILLLKKTIPFKSIVAACLAYGSGASFFLILMFYQIVHSGDIMRAVKSALFGSAYFSAVVAINPFGKYFKINAALITLNFTSAILPLAMVGWFHMYRRIGGFLTAILAAITSIELVFAIRYPVPDQFTFFLPSLIMIAVASSVGISSLASKSSRWHHMVMGACLCSLLISPIFYAGAPYLALKMGINVHRARELPFRDEMRYWIVPWKHNERSAELFARAALGEAGERGIIVCDGTSLYPLKITQLLEQRAPEVTLYTVFEIKRLLQKHDDRVLEAIKAGHVFVISPALDFAPDNLAHHLTTIREQGRILYRVVWDQESL